MQPADIERREMLIEKPATPVSRFGVTQSYRETQRLSRPPSKFLLLVQQLLELVKESALVR